MSSTDWVDGGSSVIRLGLARSGDASGLVIGFILCGRTRVRLLVGDFPLAKHRRLLARPALRHGDRRHAEGAVAITVVVTVVELVRGGFWGGAGAGSRPPAEVGRRNRCVQLAEFARQ